jgi:hypothetical protein
MVKTDPKAAKQAFQSEAAQFCPHCSKKHRTITPDQCEDRKMSERTLQNRIVGRAKTKGWKIAHAGRGIAAFDSAGRPVFVTPMSKGWPDLFMVRPGYRPLAIELKREQGEVEPEQWEWLQAMNATGCIDAIVIRPSQLRDGTVTAILGGR